MGFQQNSSSTQKVFCGQSIRSRPHTVFPSRLCYLTLGDTFMIKLSIVRRRPQLAVSQIMQRRETWDFLMQDKDLAPIIVCTCTSALRIREWSSGKKSGQGSRKRAQEDNGGSGAPQQGAGRWVRPVVRGAAALGSRRTKTKVSAIGRKTKPKPVLMSE